MSISCLLVLGNESSEEHHWGLRFQFASFSTRLMSIRRWMNTGRFHDLYIIAGWPFVLGLEFVLAHFLSLTMTGGWEGGGLILVSIGIDCHCSVTAATWTWPFIECPTFSSFQTSTWLDPPPPPPQNDLYQFSSLEWLRIVWRRLKWSPRGPRGLWVDYCYYYFFWLMV